jgi:serine/threonine protein kinase
MGAVYKARQKCLGREVALKVLHGELSGDPMFVERFLREAQALAKLAHPGIVAVHDYGERLRPASSCATRCARPWARARSRTRCSSS